MTQPMTIAARKVAIQEAVKAANTAVAGRNTTVEEIRWKGSTLVLPVALVDLDVVLLSHRSHRIKAQLKSLPQSEQDLVESDPYGEQAQSVIARLLRETAGYEQIKNALVNDGQLAAGVITDAGVLINANTRAVALRELRRQYVKVVVLPPDAGQKEITELELRLQMEQDVKQPYDFPNDLLFIEDLVGSGNYTAVEAGRALRPALTNSKSDRKKASELVEQELRLLGLIRDIQAASGGALDYVYFADKRQALIEIDQDYQKLKNTKPQEAARIKDAQLAAMISGVDYRRLREIDSSLLDGYVGTAIQESSLLGAHADVLLAPAAADPSTADGLDGLDDLLDDEPLVGPSGGQSLSGLYQRLARAKPDEDIMIPVDGGEVLSVPRNAIAAELHGALSTAIENKRRDSRHLDDLTAPMAHLKEIARTLDKAASAYAKVHDRPSFDGSAFRAAVKEYERAAAAFEDSVSSVPNALFTQGAEDGRG